MGTPMYDTFREDYLSLLTGDYGIRNVAYLEVDEDKGIAYAVYEQPSFPGGTGFIVSEWDNKYNNWESVYDETNKTIQYYDDYSSAPEYGEMISVYKSL